MVLFQSVQSPSFHREKDFPLEENTKDKANPPQRSDHAVSSIPDSKTSGSRMKVVTGRLEKDRRGPDGLEASQENAEHGEV